MAFIKFAANQLQQIGEKKKAQEAASKPAIEEAASAESAAAPDSAAPAPAAASDAGATDANKLQTDEAKRIVEDITDSITGQKKESKYGEGAIVGYSPQLMGSAAVENVLVTWEKQI